MGFNAYRPKVWHLVVGVAALAVLLRATDLMGRLERHQLRLQGLRQRERQYLSQAEFLVEEVPDLRDRPGIEGWDSWSEYSNRRLAERGPSGLLMMNPDDWGAAFARTDRENLARARELRALAAEASARRSSIWWQFWGPPADRSSATPTRWPGR